MPLIATNVLVPASSATLGAAAEVTDLWEDRLVQNQFMDEVVAVGAGDYLCAASEKNKSGNPFTPTLRCFSATSAFSPVDLTLRWWTSMVGSNTRSVPSSNCACRR